jgi:hypothetical protein
MGEDRGDGTSRAGRFGSPCRGFKIFDQNLVHAIIGGKNPDCRLAELRLNLGSTRRHGSVLLNL